MSDIYILYQFDDKYAPYAGISILSLLESNILNRITIYLAGLDVSENNIKKIDRILEIHGAKGVWLNVEEAFHKIKYLNLGKWNASYATWLKVFVLDQIAEEVDRLLYVDCDTLILGDLSELFFIDLKENAVAAVLDCLAQNNCKRLGVKRYYNAGVTLYDMHNMRMQSLTENMVCHLEENVSRYLVNDQDLLNDYFNKRIYTLPLKYNTQGFLFMYKTKEYLWVYKENFYSEAEINDAKKQPVIVHFFRIFGNYPWEKNNLHACSEIFHYWKEKSPWLELEDLPQNTNWIFAIEKILYKFLPRVLFLKLYRRLVEH